MYRIQRYVRAVLKLLAFSIPGFLLLALRYLLRTPQPLESVLPGEARLYKWTRGYIFYKIAGAPDAPPLVLLHGPEIGASSYEMRHIMEGLARHYRVYALDLLGFGLSDRPHIDYSATIYVTLYRDFLKDVVGQPAVLLASGLSCNYSIAVAAEQPELCQRVVLLSPVSLFEDKRQPGWLTTLLTPGPGLFLYAFLTWRVVLRGVVAQQRMQPYQDVSALELDYVSAAAHQLGAHYAALAWLGGKLHLNVLSQFEGLQQPVLLIWGVQALHDARLMSGKHSISAQTQVVLIRDAGVRVQEERPTKIVANVLAWLADEASPDAADAPSRLSSMPDTHVIVPAAATDAASEGAATMSAESVASEYTPDEGAEDTRPVHMPDEGAEDIGPAHISDVRADNKEIGRTSDARADSIDEEYTPVSAEERPASSEVTAGVAEQAIQEAPAGVAKPALPEAAVEDAKPAMGEETAAANEEDTLIVTAQAYCVKCRQKRIMQNARRVVTKNGRNAIEGICPVCGTKLFRFIAS